MCHSCAHTTDARDRQAISGVRNTPGSDLLSHSAGGRRRVR